MRLSFPSSAAAKAVGTITSPRQTIPQTKQARLVNHEATKSPTTTWALLFPPPYVHGTRPHPDPQEARRLENETRDALLAARKLSLIVDLDQTIIHTTVDPTVGEWLDELKKPPDGSTTPPPEDNEEINPNAEALRNVARFQIDDELPPARRGRRPPPPVSRAYYTKPRYANFT